MENLRNGEYKQHREGDFVIVEIRDYTRRVLYKNKFNLKDKNAILSLLFVLEKFSGFSIYELIKKKLEIGEWF